MASREEMAVVRELVRRHCVATAMPDGSTRVPDGYFRFDVGATARGARKKWRGSAVANVKWSPDPEAVYVEVHKRIQLLIREGAPRIYIRAIEEGDSGVIDSADVDGDPFEQQAAQDDDEDEGKVGRGRHALVEGHAAVVATQARMNERMLDKVLQLADENRELYMKHVVFQLIAEGNNERSSTAIVESLTSALGPGVNAIIPMVTAALLRSQGLDPSPAGGAPAPAPDEPSDPSARLDWLTDQVDALFARMVAVVGADPSLVTPERIGRWQGMISRTFGGGTHPPPPSAAPSPPPPEPELPPEPKPRKRRQSSSPPTE